MTRSRAVSPLTRLLRGMGRDPHSVDINDAMGALRGATAPYPPRATPKRPSLQTPDTRATSLLCGREINTDSLFESGRHFLGLGHSFIVYPKTLNTVKFSVDTANPIVVRRPARSPRCASGGRRFAAKLTFDGRGAGKDEGRFIRHAGRLLQLPAAYDHRRDVAAVLDIRRDGEGALRRAAAHCGPPC